MRAVVINVNIFWQGVWLALFGFLYGWTLDKVYLLVLDAQYAVV